jgi:hypothetical protein
MLSALGVQEEPIKPQLDYHLAQISAQLELTRRIPLPRVKSVQMERFRLPLVLEWRHVHYVQTVGLGQQVTLLAMLVHLVSIWITEIQLALDLGLA